MEALRICSPSQFSCSFQGAASLSSSTSLRCHAGHQPRKQPGDPGGLPPRSLTDQPAVVPLTSRGCRIAKHQSSTFKDARGHGA